MNPATKDESNIKKVTIAWWWVYMFYVWQINR